MRKIDLSTIDRQTDRQKTIMSARKTEETVKDPDQITIIGSIVGRPSPSDNKGLSTPLAWIMFAIALWSIAWAVIFILVVCVYLLQTIIPIYIYSSHVPLYIKEVDVYGYLNNWWGELWYFIGAAALVWIAQLIALSFYLSKKRSQLKLTTKSQTKSVETLANNGIVCFSIAQQLVYL